MIKINNLKQIQNFTFAVLALIILSACGSTLQEKIIKDDSGKITSKYNINEKTGLKEGHFTEYYDTGFKSEEGTYKKGDLEGKRIIYRYEKEEVEIVENYINNKLEGEYKTFYISSKLKQLGNYNNNVMDGDWLTYYESGQIKEKVTMSNNNENGPFIEYYENGNLKAEGNYLDGDNEHGLLKLYNEDGVLIKKMDCVKRRCKTIWKAEGEE